MKVHERESAAERRVPGEVGVWVLIFGEMVAFAVLFLTFLYYRGQDPILFEQSQRTLGEGLGVTLTLVLLSGSLLVVWAVRAVRGGQPQVARALLRGAIACGVVFAAFKFLDYHDKVADGITPQTNRFFMLYFMLTGIHMFHLVIGVLVLSILTRIAATPNLSASQYGFVEAGACYWHMVDLVWLVLFPLLYLVR